LLANFQAMKSVSRFYFYGVGMDFQKRYWINHFIIPGWSTLPGVKDFVHDSALFLPYYYLYTYWWKDHKAKKSFRLEISFNGSLESSWLVGGGYAIAASFSHTRFRSLFRLNLNIH
jgi:hypothetical protein